MKVLLRSCEAIDIVNSSVFSPLKKPKRKVWKSDDDEVEREKKLNYANRALCRWWLDV